MAKSSKKPGVPGKKMDLAAYRIQEKLSLPKRLAHLLDWAAQHYPGIFIQWNRALQAIQGFATLPSIKSDQVKSLRNRSTEMKKYLWATYTRGVAYHPLLGIRATVDHDDLLTHEGRKAVRRFDSAGQKVIEVTKGINPALLAKDNKEFYQKHLKPLAAAISTAQFAAMLDVPKEEPIPLKKILTPP
jgi:hypothetical protein